MRLSALPQNLSVFAPSVGIVVSLAAVLFLGTAEGSAKEPTLIVTRGNLRHNFGEVERGKKLAYKIEIKNVSKNAIELTRIQRGCGLCTPLDIKRTSIPPGETTEIIARFNSESRKGKQLRPYFIHTTDQTTSPIVSLRFEWTVLPFVEPRPAAVEFGQKDYTAAYDTEVVLDPEGLKVPVSIAGIECASPHVRVGPWRKDKDSSRMIIPVSILASAPAGEFTTEIVVTTDYKKDPKIVLPVRGKVAGPFAFKERYLSFGIVTPGTQMRRETIIGVAPDTKETITAVKYDKNLLSCEVKRREDGGYLLQADLLASARSGTYRTTVTLETSCKVQPAIHVPIIAVIR